MLFKIITFVAKVVFWINSVLFHFYSQEKTFKFVITFFVKHWFVISWLPLRKQLYVMSIIQSEQVVVKFVKKLAGRFGDNSSMAEEEVIANSNYFLLKN